MVARPCIEPGCPGLSAAGPRCQAHTQAHNQERNTGRPWYTDPEYRAARRQIKATATQCWACGTALTPATTTVDHVPPVSQVDDWHDCRLLPACSPCNSSGTHHNHD